MSKSSHPEDSAAWMIQNDMITGLSCLKKQNYVMLDIRVFEKSTFLPCYYIFKLDSFLIES